MLQQRTATATTIFSEVLANLAFMFVEDDAPAVAPEDRWMETTIGYHGSACGSLRFLCTEGFARLLAANLLAIDPSDPAAGARAGDAAKEFMNIVCGQLVTTLHGSDKVFDITIPESRLLDSAPDLDAVGTLDHCTFSVEGYPVQLTYTPDQRPAGKP